MSHSPHTYSSRIRSSHTGPPTFVTQTPPIISENTYIVAAASPSISEADPKEDVWFVLDFYAFNYLLKGAGAHQVWLTAAPRKIVQKYGNLLHGNPYEQRKVVLSNQLVDRNELTPVQVVKNTQIIDRFLQEVRDASNRAAKENANVLLLVFCHGTQSSSLVLDHADPSSGLTAVRLKEATGFNTRVTLVITACYSGGWAVNPDLNLTTLTAAGAPEKTRDNTKDEDRSKSVSWPESESVRRCCECMFASSVIETLTAKSTPLLDVRETPTEPSGKDLSVPDHLQPKQPNQLQTDTYNEFCRSIWDVCETRIYRLSDKLEFWFSAQDDAWEFSWTGRTGIPLSSFRERWDKLPVYEYIGSADSKARLDPSPLNPSFFESKASRSRTGSAGGASTERDIQGDLLKAMHEYKLVNMINHFLSTCRTNWDLAPEISLRAFLRNCKENKRSIDPCLDNDDEDGHFYGPLDAFRAVQFRINIAAMVDYFVARFGLTLPYNKPCLLCDVAEWRYQWKRSMSAEEYERRREGQAKIWEDFIMADLSSNPTEAKVLNSAMPATTCLLPSLPRRTFRSMINCGLSTNFLSSSRLQSNFSWSAL